MDFGVVVLLIVKINFVASVFFTISDVTVSVPRALSSLASTTNISNVPIFDLRARNTADGTTRLKYSLNSTGGYFHVNETTGRVFLTPAYLENIGEIGKIPISVVDLDSGDRDETTLQVTVSSQQEKDCDLFVEEICFWSRAVYRVEKRSGATVLGSLSSPLVAAICPYKVNYTLLTGTGFGANFFEVVPPDTSSPFWSLRTTRSFRESKKSSRSVGLLCTLENADGKEKGTIREIKRNLTVLLLNINEFPPVPQDSEMRFEFRKLAFKKNDVINDNSLIFNDQDIPEVNRYVAKIVGSKKRNLLKPNCTKLHIDVKRTTAIHCSIRFEEDVTFDESTYKFGIQLIDTAMKNKNATNEAIFPVTFEFGPPPEALKKLSLYPSNVKIFNTASLLARVTQPSWDVRSYSKFRLKETLEKPENKTGKGGPIFKVTNEGIVYVHNYVKLWSLVTEYVSINISWTKNNGTDHEVVKVRIVNEPNRTCTNAKTTEMNDSCAEFETANSCRQSSTCQIGTGGSASVEFRDGPERCMWRADSRSPNVTHLYPTCTPDRKTCPDGTCDSLEQLHYNICPQDCTRSVGVPLKLNPATGRGVDEASGVVACSSILCYSIHRSEKVVSTPPSRINTTEIHSSVVGKCGSICILTIAAGFLFSTGAIVFFVLCWRLKTTRKRIREKFEENQREMTTPLSISALASNNEPLSFNFNMTTIMNDPVIYNNIMKFSPDPKWEFPRSQLAIEQILGEGEFGRVLRAKASNISGLTGFTTVAVKTLKEDARESELNDLLMEYQLLKEVSHANVIRLLGVCTEPGGPVYLIIEYCEYGSLRNYLRKSRKLQYGSDKLINVDETEYDEPKTSDVTPKDLLSFAWQISNGMSYLSDIKLVHRDLAARNVLLAAEKICKVSDFGLTRDVYEDNAYLKRSKGRVPVKWMAPESLADHIYTSKSDVWSFGILIWELITLGSNPYPGIVVQNLYHLLRQGYRMERPNNCSPALYNIMRKCWSLDPQQRPTFQELIKRFERLLENDIEYINLSENSIHNRGYFLSPFEEDDMQENWDEEMSPEISTLNFLSKTEPCEKMTAMEKALNEDLEKMTDTPVTLEGYETPVKLQKRAVTPSNENPEEYTEMGGRE